MQKTFGTSNLFKVKPIKKRDSHEWGTPHSENLFLWIKFHMLQSQMQEQEVRLDGFLFGDLQKFVFHEDPQCIPYAHSYSRHIGESHVGTQGIHCFRK